MSDIVELIETYERAEKALDKGLRENVGKTCFYANMPHKVTERRTRDGQKQYYLRNLMSREAMAALEKGGKTFANQRKKKTS